MAFQKYAQFSGRSSRSEYWFFVLFCFIASFVIGFLEGFLGFTIGKFGILSTLFTLAMIIPSLAISWRRLHDIGRAGGWYFIGLIPVVGFIILLIWDITESQPFPNRFGEVPNVE